MAYNRKPDSDSKLSRRGAWKVASCRGVRPTEIMVVSAKVDRRSKEIPEHVSATDGHVPLTPKDIAMIDNICASPPKLTTEMLKAIERHRKVAHN